MLTVCLAHFPLYGAFCSTHSAAAVRENDVVVHHHQRSNQEAQTEQQAQMC